MLHLWIHNEIIESAESTSLRLELLKRRKYAGPKKPSLVLMDGAQYKPGSLPAQSDSRFHRKGLPAQAGQNFTEPVRSLLGLMLFGNGHCESSPDFISFNQAYISQHLTFHCRWHGF
jgi:hypothetical protein